MSSHFIDTSFVPADIDCADWPQVESLFRELQEREIKTTDDLEKWWHDRSELEAAISEAQAARYIKMTCHTEDEEAKKAFLFFVEEISPKVKPMVFALDRKHAECEFAADLDTERYSVLDRDTKNEVRLFRQENIPLETELEKLSQQYNEVCGAMTCEFDGREQTMPQMARYLEETDRPKREAAWRCIAERRFTDKDRLNEIFDDMRPKRHQIALNAGFDNYRDYMFRRMRRFDYTPTHCEAFHSACEKVVVPLLRKIDNERREALGLTELRPWDTAVDVKGRAPLRPFETVDELVDRTEKVFQKMDPALGDLFSQLRAPGCLDLDTRKGKAPGGYQYNRDRVREPFIFMNAAGLARDADTLLHEGGHAFHSLLCAKEPLLHYRHTTMEFAEVASMTMELMAHPYMSEYYPASEDEARSRRKHLEGIVHTLPWIATIDAFQHWIYTNPHHQADDRTRFWLSLTERFGPSLNWSGVEHYLESSWQRQLHLYEVPFYYIEYGIAQLGALQIWLRAKGDRKGALADYKKSLALGGSRPLPELFTAAGAEFDFGVDAVKGLIEAVERELEQLPL